MTFTIWLAVIGILFITMALGGSVLRRLPLSTSMLYLGVGIALGPVGVGLIDLDPVSDAGFLERVTEIAVIISLFSAGLKLRSPLAHARWHRPVRLAVGAMVLTVVLIALAGVVGLGLPLGAAILLGAVLAPTDPVLASDVQVEHAGDQDRVRFGLTGEAGLNDGTAFPFVMLGLGLLELHALGAAGWRWLAVDVLWAVAAGLGLGALLGVLVGRLVLYLRRTHREALGLDDFLSLGLIALSYSLAVLAHAYGFLAVFAAGVALRAVERRASEERSVEENPDAASVATGVAGREDDATDPQRAPAYMAQAVLGFTEQLERIGEVVAVVLLGGMLALHTLTADALWFMPVLFLAIRPLSVWLALVGSHLTNVQQALVAWFGIRGIGSLYYLMYAISHGLPDDLARRLTGLVLSTVTASIIVHGISVTPVMRRYGKSAEGA